MSFCTDCYLSHYTTFHEKGLNLAKLNFHSHFPVARRPNDGQQNQGPADQRARAEDPRPRVGEARDCLFGDADPS